MIDPIFIQGRALSANHSPYIIAEISANHNGSIDRAKATILAAKQSGVDAVKLQTYTPDTMTIDSNLDDFSIKKGLWKGRTLYDLYGEAFTPFEWHKTLFDYAKSLEITLFSSPFDESAVDLLESLNTPAYKVASFELVDLPLIKYMAKKNKPILMSTGMANLVEIGEAIEVAKINGCHEIALFHCISCYPAPLNQANLSSIIKLRDEFKVQVGLSDHTLGNTASIVATTLGATLIEKHFTLNRDDGGVDSSFSLEPNEMAALVNECKGAFDALGNQDFNRPVVEDQNKIFRRSIYFVENLKQGEVITEKHIRRIRPGFGLAPKHYENVLGSRVKCNVTKGERVTLELIEFK